MNLVYLDHSATTPVDPEVVQVMYPFLTSEFYNPSSVYSKAQNVRQHVEKSRESVARLIGAQPNEIVFTSGGTEADNMAIIGTVYANPKKGRHIITSAIEHHAVLDTCLYLEKQGYELTILPVTREGVVEPKALEEAMRDDTVLVSIMHANNEVGTIQPIKELAAIAHKYGAIFHTDAVQTAGKIPIDVKDLGVDLLSASAHKIHGPKGVGCLYIRKGIRVQNRSIGGGQERKRRGGTENVPGIIGFGKAAELSMERMEADRQKLEALAAKLTAGILKNISNVRLTGHPTNRIPGHVSVSLDYVEGESVILMLDHAGIMTSSGSACTSGSLEPSHVLLAMGYKHEEAHGSLRMTLGRDNTEEDVDYVLEMLPPIVQRLRELSPICPKGDEQYVF